MRIAAIITARHKSKRLPKKHMLKLGDLSMIEILIKRLQQNNRKFSIILCTTKDKSDDAFTDIAKKLKIDCYRGYKLNVKGRVLKAAKKFSVDHIVKIWGDSPFLDVNIINKALDEYLKFKPDVLSTNPRNEKDKKKNISNQFLPQGMDFDIYSTHALEKSLKYSNKISDFEHVNTVFFKKKDIFKTLKYIPDKKLFFPKAKLLLDEKSDYDFFKKLYEIQNFRDNIINIRCDEIINILKKL